MRLLVLNLRMDAAHSTQATATAWVNALAARAEAVFVITMHQGELCVAPNVRVFSTGREQGLGRLRQAARFYRLLLGILRRERIAYCFVHMASHLLVLGGPLLRLRRIPVSLWIAHSARPLSLRLAHFWADHIVTVSAESFPLASNKVRIIGHGIDTSLFRPEGPAAPDRPFVVGTVGRFSRQKTYEVLIEAAGLLRAGGEANGLSVVLCGGTQTEGEAAYRAELEAAVAGKGLADLVKFHPEVPHREVPRLLSTFSVFVDLQPLAGPNKATLEAMAQGLPTLMCTPACNGQLGEDRNLVVYEAGSPASLAEVLKRLRALPAEEKRALGLRLRRLVKQGHSLENLAERIMALGLRGS